MSVAAARERASTRLLAIANIGSGALVPALQSALLVVEQARDIVEAARRVRLATSGEQRSAALEQMFAAVDALDFGASS